MSRKGPIRVALAIAAACGLGCSAEPPGPEGPLSVVRAPVPPVLPRPEPAAPVTSCAELSLPSVDIVRSAEDPASVPLVRGELLAPFYEEMARLARGLATDHLRIAVYGDSNLTMDYPTGAMRRALQRALGDGGHGYVALGQPWSHYQHMDVRHRVESGYKPYAITTRPTGDGLYGLSGIVVENEWQGATTWVATAKPAAPVGTHMSRLEVFFLEGKSFGTFDVRVDGGERRTVDTRAETIGLGVHREAMPDGPHRVEVIASSARRVRLLGAVLERDRPGVVLDSFGVGALNTKTMARADPALSAEMLRARDYDLVVFMTGANDIFTLDEVAPAMDSLVALHREALPGVPIVMMTPADRGKHKSFGRTLLVVDQRRRLAEEHGAVLWDLWSAMGGRDSMARLLERGMAHKDAIHFNEAGGAFVGERFVEALFEDFARYMGEHPEAGCSGEDSFYDGL